MTRVVRLLIIARSPYPTDWPCLEALYSRRFTERGHTVEWYQRAGGRSGFRRFRRNDRESVIVTPALTPRGPLSRVINQCLGWLYALYLWRVIDPARHDAVQVRDYHLAAFVAQRAARARGLPFFYWMSFPYAEADCFRSRDLKHRLNPVRRLFYRLRGTLGRWLLYRHVLPHADGVFVTSAQMRRDLIEDGVPGERIVAAPMAVELDDTRHAKPATDPRLKGRAPVVYLGTADPLRRLEVLVDAMARVVEQRPDALLVCVGGDFPAERERLRHRAGELGLQDHVLFTGELPRQGAWGYVLAARVSLSPFRPVRILRNASPTKLVESMALARPLVANEHPDHRTVLGESGAGLLVPFSADGFAEGILRLLNDPETADAMGRRGPAWVAAHRTFERLAAAVEAVYLHALDERRAVS